MRSVASRFGSFWGCFHCRWRRGLSSPASERRAMYAIGEILPRPVFSSSSSSSSFLSLFFFSFFFRQAGLAGWLTKRRALGTAVKDEERPPPCIPNGAPGHARRPRKRGRARCYTAWVPPHQALFLLKIPTVDEQQLPVEAVLSSFARQVLGGLDGRTGGRTDGRADGRTDGRTQQVERERRICTRSAMPNRTPWPAGSPFSGRLEPRKPSPVGRSPTPSALARNTND
ncbi:hypothetical protein LX36DRAFT_493404 [Colletotrichum falcatum]|nr:hypothetical protein LX36DRAFT_493404 [Colletotrichum falcatum]